MSSPAESQSLSATSDDNGMETVEFPPPLSAFDRLQRAATFWSTAVPIVLNYYGILTRTKTLELLGKKLSEEQVEVSYLLYVKYVLCYVII